MNPYVQFVEGIQAGLHAAKHLSVSGYTEPLVSGAKVLLFSPHPDDECITGLLPLRLMRETGRQVINVPVTLGSNLDRREGRFKELQDACDYLGWSIHLERNDLDPLVTDDVVQILTRHAPDIIFMPHVADWNSRHIATHHLVRDALQQMDPSFSCSVVETEFWGAMDDPNVMVEGDAQTVADLVAATSLHIGEVARNPYHLLLPAWMQDNVRRGTELVGGQGASGPGFSFATLYRFRKWEKRKLVPMVKQGSMLGVNEDLKEIF